MSEFNYRQRPSRKYRLRWDDTFPPEPLDEEEEIDELGGYDIIEPEEDENDGNARVLRTRIQ